MREEVLVDGRFRLEAEVAVGGMGRLWRAHDEHTRRTVALKVIATDQPGADERFRREAQLLAKLRHPALVEHVAHGTTPTGEPYLAMEWLGGRDLRAALAQRTNDVTLAAKATPTSHFEVADVVAFARRIASALGELHRHGVVHRDVHRDVKPANLFLEDGDLRRAKLVDLGAAAVLEGPRKLTMTGGLVGTPAYMAPEQVRETEGVTPAADVWALGCVLYECLTGGPAFRAQHMVALLAKILLDPPRSTHGAECRSRCVPSSIATSSAVSSTRPSPSRGIGRATTRARCAPGARPPARCAKAAAPGTARSAAQRWRARASGISPRWTSSSNAS